MGSLDLSQVDKILKGQRGEEALIPALRKVQTEYGYIPSEVMALIAKALKVAQSRVYSVATFYDEFHIQPMAGQSISEQVAEEKLEKRLGEQILPGQKRIVLRNIGDINPEDIDSYISVGGYSALKKVLSSMSPRETAKIILSSGLRERDGGFLVGEKWLWLAEASADKKYVVCYASDKEPGMSINKILLEGDPHSLLEGVMIAAYAIGASECYLYLPDEFTLTVKRLGLALEQARERGFLGSNPKATSFTLNIEVRQGPRFLACEPEIGIITFIEDNRASPRISPPFPKSPGLWGKPTFVGSAETFYNMPWIIQNGPDAYAQYGIGNNQGTKVLALSGKVAHTGIAEVPTGMNLGQLISDIGGGIKKGYRLKGIYIGGASGGFLPANLLDTSLTYSSLAELGLDFGSGIVAVLDESICAVALTKFFIHFTSNYNCGACVPGRLGVRQMLEILTRLSQGEGKEADIQHLEQIGNLMKETSLCAMGRMASNPVLTSIRYFRDEYEAHIYEKKCPAGVCQMNKV